MAEMTEADFLAAVAEYAKLRGWLVAHHRPARTQKGWRTAGSYDTAGYPDLTMARAGIVIVAELKLPGRKPTAAQRAWLEAAAGYLWTPDDWDQIEQILR